MSLIVKHFDMETTTVDNPRVAADVETIAALWQQISTPDIKLDTETTRMLMAGLKYFVTRDVSRRIIGAVSLLLVDNAAIGKIDSLAVAPNEQHKGYGTLLAANALQYAFNDAGCESVMTHALPSAQRLFGRLGFEAERTFQSGAQEMWLTRNDFTQPGS